MFTKRIVSQGPIRSAIEIMAENVIPSQSGLSVRMQCLIYAEHQETEVRVSTSKTEGAELTLAPGIVKLPREQAFNDSEAGSHGSWGWQEDAVGEIGLGLIVSPEAVAEIHEEEGERRIRCRPSGEGKLRYWLVGDRRRGRQHPIAPTVQNWRRELSELAAKLLAQASVAIGEPEKVQ